MAQHLPLSEAAEAVGVHRNTLWRWVNSGKLKSEPGPMVKNLQTRLVNVAEAKKLAKELDARGRVGRPRKAV